MPVTRAAEPERFTTRVLIGGACLLLFFASCQPAGEAADAAPPRVEGQAAAAAAQTAPAPATASSRQEVKPGAEEIRLVPVDEGTRDRSFEEFRANLLKAAGRRDAEFILNALDSQVRLSHGGHGGVKDFESLWNPRRRDSPLWKELAAVLSLGGSFETSAEGREFCAPYVSSKWRSVVEQHPDHSDPFKFSAVIRKDAKVRSAPAETASVLATLSYSVVRLDGDEAGGDEPPAGDARWVKIIMPTGGRGYLAREDVRSPIDYSICFKNVKGRWLIASFVAGD